MTVLKKLFKKNDADLRDTMSDPLTKILVNDYHKSMHGIALSEIVEPQLALEMEAKRIKPIISLKKTPLPSDILFDSIASYDDYIYSDVNGYSIRAGKRSESQYQTTYYFITIDYDSIYGNYFIYYATSYGYPDQHFNFRTIWLEDLYTQEELAIMYAILDKKHKANIRYTNKNEWYEEHIKQFIGERG